MEIIVPQPLVWLSVFSLTIGLTSCGVSTVRSVHERPQRSWFNSTVHLEGTVIDRVPLLNAQVYQLQDGTGAIWILTTDPSLQPGEQIVVKGKVRFESIPIAGQELGEAYIEEQQRQSVQNDGAE
jgi:hypothetical protein